MSDAEVVVRASRLTKVYRLYSNPSYRLLDLFGLLPRSGAFTEHTALDAIDLEIRRGEKIAFIGRNGAGKSTLLKLITGVIAPTHGELEVRRGTQALLQIGAGFHGDFTGRQNVVAYLAHQGIGREDATRRMAQIIEFAELEEYIDQPIKTYSTGMVARLMFAASTSIVPEVLVLDEILGVGDAYFAQKSFERIREMCDGGRTTVLLVSHDIYSASKLCDRMIWLDAGRIVVDDRASVVIRAYEDSIRVQEEARLRRKSQLRLAELQRVAGEKEAVRVELRSVDNAPLAGPVHVAAIEVDDGEARYAADLRETDAPHDGECWGDFVQLDGQVGREMRDYGALFRRVSAPVQLPAGTLRDKGAALRVCVRLYDEMGSALAVSIYDGNRRIELGRLSTARNGWAEVMTAAEASAGEERHGMLRSTVYGTGDIQIVDVRLRNAAGEQTFHVRHGEAVTLEFEYVVRRPCLDEPADVLVSMYRDGVHEACKYFSTGLHFGGPGGSKGAVRVEIDRLPLPNGTYFISVMLAKAGYYASNPSIYFSINPDVYACLSRYLEFEVYGGDLVASGMGLVEVARWSIQEHTGRT